MSCVYHLIAPRLQEETRWNAIFQNVLFGSGSRLVRLLAVPVLPSSPSPEYSGLSIDLPDDNNSKSLDKHVYTDASLLGLPYELHDLIFSFLDHVDDTICLGLTDQYFWSIGQRYMHKYYMSFYGRWANTNILYAPVDLAPDDLPPCIFSTDKTKHKPRLLQNGPASDMLDGSICGNSSSYTATRGDSEFAYDSDDSDFDEFSIQGRFPYELTYTKDCDVPRPPGKSFLNCKVRDIIDRLCATRPSITQDPAWACVQHELRVDEALYFPPDQPWILRNWTTHEIVRTDALAQAPELAHGPCTHVLGLGDAVVMRTAWASTQRLTNLRKEASEKDRNELTLGRGAWAGHCFDIVLQSEHERQTSGGVGWQDVSEEVARELTALQASHYGSDWLVMLLEGQVGNTCRFY